jgi:hypothetical protein
MGPDSSRAGRRMDPIGTKDAFVPQDEYDCCLGSLFHLLTTGATDDEIADYLWRQGTEPMGLDLRKENMYPAVAALREIPPAESVTV